MFDRIPDMAAKRAEISPERVAFADVASGRDWSFAQINRAAAGLAAGLRALGLGPGDRLAALCHNRVEFFVALFAAQKSGIILAPLNWRQPVAELGPVLDSVGASAIIFDDENAAPARALARSRAMAAIAMDAPAPGETAFAELAAAPAPFGAGMIDADRPWYLLFTSGTTGLPKAVIQTARMAWANAVNIGQAADLGADTATANFLPLFHTAGINLYALPTFLEGGLSHVLRRFEPDMLFDLIRQGRINRFFGVPAIYQAFSLRPEADEIDWSALGMGCGGAPLPEPLIRFFAERGGTVCNGMGMTETGPTVFLMDAANAARKVGSVGRPQMLTEVRLAGVPDGAPGEGEIQIRGPNVTPGYFGNDAATAEAFAEDGWLRSGDVGRRDEDGYYYIVDRIKDMYISGGENVYPAEVERVLNAHPAVLEAAVIGVPDPKWGEVGMAFLILRPGRAVEPQALDAWCRERLAAYKTPRAYRILDDFPRTAAGKVRKPELRKMIR
ncbi:AMP-binding protein [Oceanicella actignis]|uniref:3-methylmercaptopropionyl-CoA ligase n=1 Tax=Oceanicella actignis TaxID=1189325 RepID=A0A1M7SFC9_9RHOB|nr:AMP-binding protein [Oceanicella actignis]SET22208.1 fatty-acyl-CoA synthase [Oceanicella actignis]SHN57218.1 fatty-acyl-CoA synthase [Oceanicella actignis]